MAFLIIKRRRGKLWPFAVLAAAILIILADGMYYRGRVYPGVYLKEVSLGGRTAAEAESLLENLQVSFSRPGDNSIMLPLADLGIKVDSELILEEALHRGRSRIFPLNYPERLTLLREKASIPLHYHINEKTLLQGLASIENAFYRAPENAYFAVTADESVVTLIPETPGCRIIGEELRRRFLTTLDLRQRPLSTAVPFTLLPAEITAAALKEMGIQTLRASFSTTLDLDNTDRTHNIELAASHLDNRFTAPGEIISINWIIGDTTPEKGYREAPIMIGSRIAPGYGGGLCQVSSTLYNAALLAGLEIVERHNHNMTVPYLDPGRDATISYGAHDLKLRNNTGHFTLLKAFLENDTLVFQIFGATPEESVEIETRQLAVYPPPVRYEFDPSLDPGEEETDEGEPGGLFEVWKIVYRRNMVESKQIISVDSYNPYPTVIRYGPANEN